MSLVLFGCFCYTVVQPCPRPSRGLSSCSESKSCSQSIRECSGEVMKALIQQPQSSDLHKITKQCNSIYSKDKFITSLFPLTKLYLNPLCAIAISFQTSLTIFLETLTRAYVRGAQLNTGERKASRVC